MKKKILFYAPYHFDIDKAILTELEKLKQYQVTKLSSNKYRYKNNLERLYNFLGKIFLKKTLKKQWMAKIQMEEILTNQPFDLCLMMRPDLLEKNVLEKIKNTIPIRKVFYWDSFNKIPAFKETLPYFNQYFTFEEEDALKYNLKKISNFYIHRFSDKKVHYDAFFFGSKDSRLHNISKLIAYLKNKNWNAKALLVGKKTTNDKTDGVEIIKNGIPFAEIYKFAENTQIVIDISHPNQKGLSMRPYEALGLERKLITNNSEIKKYDFYNPNNIYIIEDFDNLDIPNSFLEQPYEKISEDIYNKYHISSWLNFILK
ncbi:hypothetical protein MG290_04955 [Flavobacterium sp. CBA20B-1]|uniref:hypothetical protein n=1 Tax=unclassified Flavobacterium TaxID=196869 RepID=UPI002223FE90|nr:MULTISPECIES: hypothetical protein [unclassified Flavobacterium]WCM43024.1 hypothetical protein MG290_04955 [Flavobacterium sp. CBA20B-1]